jgi:hypothetical protein
VRKSVATLLGKPQESRNTERIWKAGGKYIITVLGEFDGENDD